MIEGSRNMKTLQREKSKEDELQHVRDALINSHNWLTLNFIKS